MKKTDFEKSTLTDIMQLYGWSVSEFARVLGISRQLVEQWIGGGNIPTTKSLLNIVNSLSWQGIDIDIDYFFVKNDVPVQHGDV